MFLLLGFSLTRALVPGGRRVCLHDAWRGLLGAGLGVGISSFTYLARLQTGIPQFASDLALLIGFSVWAWRARAVCPFCSFPPRRRGGLDVLLVGAFAVALAAAAIVFLRQTIANPHGQFDGWAIHNLHARFLDHPDAWRDLFTPLLTWSQADYPLLLPAFIAGSWQTIGSESPLVPALTAFLFTFGGAALVTSSVALLRGRPQGLLAGLVLLSAPSFVVIGSGQLADVPLAWFLLAASVLQTMNYSAAAGLAAGCAAWTKNEGVLLFVAFVAGWGLARQWTASSLRHFGMGAIIPLGVLLWFKLTLAPTNPMILPTGNWARLTDFSRQAVILVGFTRQLWHFGGLFPGAILLLVVYAVLMRVDSVHRASAQGVALSLVLGVFGYWSVYTFTAYNLAQLIDSSLDRLFVHLWPTAVFLIFLATNPAVIAKGAS